MLSGDARQTLWPRAARRKHQPLAGLRLCGEDGDMTEREAFIEAIATQPEEDTPRLAFADWLQEHGEEARAQFVRLSHELSASRSSLADYDNPPADVLALEQRIRALFERHRAEWLGPFCRALGTTVPRCRERWSARLWRRVSGKAQPADPFSHFKFGSIRFDNWDDGPVSGINLWRGFVNQLDISFRSPRPLGDLAAALRLEPVNALTARIVGHRDRWEGLNRPCLSRIKDLTVDVSGEHGQPAIDVLERVIHGPYWSGVRDLYLWRSIADFQPAPREYIERLAGSPLLPNLRGLSLMIEQPDLPPLTTNPRLAQLDRFVAWGCHMLPSAVGAIAHAAFSANLKELNLALNNLGDDGVGHLTPVALPELRRLELDANGIGDAGVRNLLPLVSRLACLSLSSGQITDTGAMELADALDAERLEWVCLSYNPLSPETVAALRERFGSRFAFVPSDDT